MTPELSSSGLPQNVVDQMVGIYTDSFERLSKTVLNPWGASQTSKEWKAARAASLSYQIDQQMKALKVASINWVGGNLPQAFKDGIDRADAQVMALGIKGILGAPKALEDPIADLWRKQAAKMSLPKLKQFLLSTQNASGDKSIIELGQKIAIEELQKRGVVIKGYTPPPQLEAQGPSRGDVSLQGSFGLIDHKSIEVIAQDIVGDLSKAADATARQTKTILRRSAQLNLSESDIDRVIAHGIIEGTPAAAIRDLRDQFRAIGDGKVRVRDRNGSFMEFDAGYYARMVVRTKTRQATVTARHDRLQELGLDLVSIVGMVSKNFCTAYLGQVYSLSGRSKKYPSIRELPGYGDYGAVPPFHPNCSKSTRPFVEELASEKQLDMAEGDDDQSKMLGIDSSEAQRRFKDLQLYGVVKKRYATTANKLFN